MNKIEEGADPSLYDFPSNLQTNLQNPDWWKGLKQLEQLIAPYCAALNKLQADGARLYEVLHGFAWIMRLLKAITIVPLRIHYINKVETRWADWEQPLILLSFVLHPQYKMKHFNQQLKNLSIAYLGKWIKYYFQSWTGKVPQKIQAEFFEFLNEVEPFDNETFEQFHDPLKYWGYVAGHTKELHQVALKIFAISVNSASVE